VTYPPQQQNPFSQPSSAGGDTFNAADHNGFLLLVYPKSYQDEVQTKNGLSSAAEVDIVVVDKPGPDGKPLFFQNARLFGNLARSVRNDLGGQVLGRLGQGPNTRGTPPWILMNFTDQDAAMAGPVHAQYQQGLFKAAAPAAPTTPAAAPAAPQYPAPAAPAAPQQQWQAQQQFPQGPAQPDPNQAQQPPFGGQQQYQQPPQQQWPQQPQYGAPAPGGQPAAPAPAQAPAGAGLDPAVQAKLAAAGITLPPGATPEQAAAIAANLPG
jgi:hypothetical protein